MITLHWRNRFLMGGWEERSVMAGLLANTILRNMGLAAVALFLPIYIYKVGGLWMVIGYTVVSRWIEMVVSYFVARAITELGFKKSVALSGVFLASTLVLFEYAKYWSWLIWVSALIVPFAALFYWISFHLIFLETNKKVFGEELGLLSVAARWSGVAGPLIGGGIIFVTGFGGLFWWGVVFTLLSIIPILLMDDKRLRWEFNLNGYWKGLVEREFRRDLFAYVGEGLEEIMFDCFWPVFLLIILKQSHLMLGGFKTAILIVSSLLFLIVGKKIDHGGAKRYMLWSTIAMTVLWIVRGVWQNAWGLLWIDMLDGLLAITLFLPFSVYTYRRADQFGRATYMAQREAALSLGRGLSGVLVGIVYAVNGGWNEMVWIGIVGLWMTNLIPKSK